MDCSITFAFLGNFARHSRSVRENIVDMEFHYIDEYYCNILQLQYQSHSKRWLVCLETAYSEIIRNPMVYYVFMSSIFSIEILINCGPSTILQPHTKTVAF